MTQFVNLIRNRASSILDDVTTAGDKAKLHPRITKCWSIINGPGSYNNEHIHPNSIFSGVIYVDVPPNSGDIEFIDPRTLNQMVTYPFASELLTNNPLRITPVRGTMLIFPAWLLHRVTENRSTDERIIFSFNIVYDEKA
jgi:uncharacterized protein (TIGR02466 family)